VKLDETLEQGAKGLMGAALPSLLRGLFLSGALGGVRAYKMSFFRQEEIPYSVICYFPLMRLAPTCLLQAWANQS